MEKRKNAEGFTCSARAAEPCGRSTSRASGFTLIELLVVVAIIAVLIGIVAPLAAGMAERARDSRARDLCGQMVDSWNILVMQNSRLPYKDLLSSVADTEQIGGDLWFPMTPAVGELLNGWTAKSPIPKADVKNYEPRVAIAKGDVPEYADAIDFPPDRVFERSILQKRVGVFVPWVERRLAEELSGEDFGANRLYEVPSSALEPLFKEKGPFRHGLICVALDADGDGTITIPADTIDNGDDIVLRATAVAWVWNEDRSKTIRSW